MPVQKIEELIDKVMAETATSADFKALEQYVKEDPTGKLTEYIHSRLAAAEDKTAFEQEKWEAVSQDILNADKMADAEIIYRKNKRIHFLSGSWLRYAAAILLILSACAYLWISLKEKKPESAFNPAPVQKDITAPAGLRATLTLANGEKVFLDSVGSGRLSMQGSTIVEKTEEGGIVYSTHGNDNIIQYNTLSVPRGSQIAHIILSDGSKVFLNVASSIKYPVAFDNKERRVEVSGEAYFEIAKDTKRKFIVTNGDMQTEVLGTQFNFNAYADESAKKVTLVEGSVKVSSKKQQVIIKPGQQAEMAGNNQIKTNENFNMSQVLSWRKGVFVLNNMDLQSIMRQVSRWYNVQIEYRGNIQAGDFGGTLSRRSPLSEVIKILSSYGVKCTLNESTLIIEK